MKRTSRLAAVRALQSALDELRLLRGNLGRSVERSPTVVRAAAAAHVLGIIRLIEEELRLQGALQPETMATATPPVRR